MKFTLEVELHEAFVNSTDDLKSILSYASFQVGCLPENTPWTDKRVPIMDNGVEVGTWGFVGTGREGV